MIFTFYSYKGGVGRSMALANVGVMLAQRGHKVIACDWDLEAPGLESYFASDSRLKELREKPGIIDLILEYKMTMAGTEASLPDDAEACSRIGDLRVRRPRNNLVEVFRPSSGDGVLHLLTAGGRGGDAERRYVNAVQRFDWSEFYESWAGNSYIEFFRKDLEGWADFVLVDSRTGITEQGGVCTHHLADVVVLLTGANDQHLVGSMWMAEALRHPELTRQRGDRSLRVLPVASRLEITAEEAGLAKFREEFREKFLRVVPTELGSPDRLLRGMEIPYIPAYSFHERLVALEVGRKRSRELYDAYLRLSEAIVDLARRASHMPARVLISYAHQDKVWCDRLCEHLGHFAHSGELRTLADLDIQEDSQAIEEIRTELRSSDLVVLLITPRFMASRWGTIEMMSTVRDGLIRGGRAIPVIVDHCDWSSFALGESLAMPRDDNRHVRPLVDWPNPNPALADVAKMIRLLLSKTDEEFSVSTPSVFISYSHRDREWKDRFVAHLSASVQKGRFDQWSDEVIGAGEDWYAKIIAAMDTASVAVFLISADFLGSDFILREEITHLIERREREGLHIVPVYLRKCDWEAVSWLARMQMRPAADRCVIRGADHIIDEEFADIAKEIRLLLRKTSWGGSTLLRRQHARLPAATG